MRLGTGGAKPDALPLPGTALLPEEEADTELQGDECRVGNAFHAEGGFPQIPLAFPDLLVPFDMEADAEILGDKPIERETDADVSLGTLPEVERTARGKIVRDGNGFGVQVLEIVGMELVEGDARRKLSDDFEFFPFQKRVFPVCA